MAAKRKRKPTPSLLAAARSRKPGAARAEIEPADGPHRGDSDERKGRGGSPTRGRGEDRRGSKRPSRSKD